MALYKGIVSDSGVVSTYHRIDEVYFKDGLMNCVVTSYISKEYRDLNRSVERHFISFDNITVEEEESMGIRQLAYTKVKTLEEWSDASDC